MKRSVWITFGSLCLLSSNAWVVAPFGSSTLPPLEQLGILYSAIGLCGLLVSGKKLWSRGRKRPWAQLALASLMFFGLPAIAIELASGVMSEVARSALFALVPIVVVIAVAAGEAGEAGGNDARRFLLPALVGLTGLLLLLPLNLPGSTHGRVMFAVVCMAVILAGVSSVWLYRLLPQFEPSDAVALMCLSNGALLLACCLGGRIFLWSGSDLITLASFSSLVNLIEVLLLLWLVREMPPVRFASRFLVIPLLTVLEAYILVRPEPTFRTGGGVVLLAIGVGMLLFVNPAEDKVSLSLQ